MFGVSRSAVEGVKRMYSVGDRVELVCMEYDPRPIAEGTRGTVRHVDDMGTVHVNWDNGRSLGMCVLDGDVIRKV